MLVERFINLLLVQIKTRRTRSRDAAGVAVQCAISLGVAQQVFNLSARRGEIRSIGLSQFVKAYVEVSELNRPIYLSLLEDCTGWTRAQVHAACKRLREAGVLYRIDRDRIFRAPPENLSSAALLQQVLPDEVWHSTVHFVNVARRVLGSGVN